MKIKCLKDMKLKELKVLRNLAGNEISEWVDFEKCIVAEMLLRSKKK